MADIISELKQRFRRGDIVTRLIFINVGVFLLTTLAEVCFMLFKRSMAPVLRHFELPASFEGFLMQPWSIATYMFMHADIFHILFNMLWLYWFGALFVYNFSSKHLRGLYVLGGLFGGLCYMLAYNIFPLFQDVVYSSFMVGASASILAIVAATAYRIPEYPIRLLFLGSVRLKYLALGTILLDLLLLTSGNAGGHIAHVGGALAGLCFAILLKKGIDLTRWINVLIDAISGVFDPKRWKREPKMKVHRGGATSRQQDYNFNARKKAQTEEIDRILDKLKKSGYGSLTTEEKKSLFDASKK